ncbi:MAG: putative signal transducing protein [Acidimicrobiia bacterium]
MSLVLLARVSDPGTAQILAARLQSEGVEVRMRGEWMGPYRLTVGAMAETELWVPEADIELSRMVMMAAEIDEALEGTQGEP